MNIFSSKCMIIINMTLSNKMVPSCITSNRNLQPKVYLADKTIFILNWAASTHDIVSAELLSYLQVFEMSKYLSDTPKAHYKHVTGALHALNTQFNHALGTLQKHLTKVRSQDLGIRNVHVAYTTCLKCALSAFVVCLSHL